MDLSRKVLSLRVMEIGNEMASALIFEAEFGFLVR